jgi:hypothetical protein
MLSSDVMMLLCGIVMKVTKWRWINDYALPLSMVFGMAMAIPFTAWLGPIPEVSSALVSALV